MTRFIYGMHDEGAEGLFLNNGVTGWIVFTESIGHDPDSMSGRDYSAWSDRDFGVLVRLNNGYHPNGTIPEQEFYVAFAQRCANYVANSRGCERWIIGNEPNHEQERPNGHVITYEDYATCYTLCREAIHTVLGHEDDEVCVAAIAPWNVQTGDWLRYFEEVLLLALEDGGVDAIALHTYTHGPDPSLIWSAQKMDAPYTDRYYHFQAYRQFMELVPEELQDVPVYITETNQDEPWLDSNDGWIQNAYREIDIWNKTNGQQICALCLYRWGQYDQWGIFGKQAVIRDFQSAMAHGYKWGHTQEETEMRVVYQSSFEEGFYDYNGEGELTVPNGWTPAWVNDPAPDHKRPEYDMKDNQAGQPEVRTGRYAANWFMVSARFDGVIYKKFIVTPGVAVRASVWCMGVEARKAGFGMTIGVDPNGGTNFQPSDFYAEWWSDYMTEYQDRKWVKVTRSILAGPTGEITVFLRAKSDYAGPHMGSHWDDVLVEADDESTPPAPGDCPTLSEIRAIIRQELNSTKLTS